MPRPALLLLATLALVAPGCGDSAQPTTTAGRAEAPAGKPARTRAALEALFAAVRADDRAAAAARVVYRGPDKARSWKSLCDYGQETDRARVDGLLERLRPWIGDGTVEFVEFRSETESEGEWLVWKVKAPGATAWYACLDIDGTIALGDVDKS